MGERVLTYSRVTAPGAVPSHWMILLHGIFGTGGNLRTLARRLVERQPQWGFVLPDLRAHGGSVGLAPPVTSAASAGLPTTGPDGEGSALGVPTPHAWFEEAARDVMRLEATLGHPVQGLAGHSFGGKVALTRVALGGPTFERLIVLDSAPGADLARLTRDQAGQILQLLETISRPIRSREAFLDEITGAGHSRPIAEWLAMQVRRAGADDGGDGSTYELRLELPAIRSMLEGYFSMDRWGVLEKPPVGTRVLVVVGGRSTVVGAGDVARLKRLEEGGLLEVRVLARAGHWLHVDDLDGLVDVVAAHLSLQ